MKSKIYSFRYLAMILVLSVFSQSAKSQEIYWGGGEGFQSGEGFPAAVPFNPAFVTSTKSGTWYNFLFNRTTGATGACTVVTGTPDHARFYNYNSYIGSNPNLGPADSGFCVTPPVYSGIKELHFMKSRDNRRFTIYKTSTTDPVTAVWTLAAQSFVGLSPSVCVDTTYMINDASAKMLKIVARSGTDSDIDSLYLVSMSPILPVKFNGISAVTTNGFTKVLWSNAVENNTRAYIIEKSSNGTTFTNVDEVAAINVRSYSWIDNVPATGVSYYRVKAIDKDGRLVVSNVVKMNSVKKAPEFVVAPNVVSGRNLNIQLNNIEKGNVSFNVSNSSGQVVYRTSLMNEGGAVTRNLQLPSSLNAGTYRIQMNSGATLLTQTVVLQ